MKFYLSLGLEYKNPTASSWVKSHASKRKLLTHLRGRCKTNPTMATKDSQIRHLYPCRTQRRWRGSRKQCGRAMWVAVWQRGWPRWQPFRSALQWGSTSMVSKGVATNWICLHSTARSSSCQCRGGSCLALNSFFFSKLKLIIYI